MLLIPVVITLTGTNRWGGSCHSSTRIATNIHKGCWRPGSSRSTSVRFPQARMPSFPSPFETVTGLGGFWPSPYVGLS